MKIHNDKYKSNKMIVTLSSFSFMVDKSPISLRNILSTRAVFSTVVEKISSEMVSENVVINEINKMEYSHHIDVIPIIIITLCLIRVMTNLYNTPQKEKLERIELFSKIQRTTSTFLFVFMLIFTKNIDSVT